MKKLTPDEIQDLVTIAFTLEPLAEKAGCTTRTIDQPGKPLTDFLIAGINSSRYFRYLAEDVAVDPNMPIFAHYVEALRESNRYKSAKSVNFGLLEIMFPVVYARLICEKQNQIVDTIFSIMKRPSKQDVMHMINGRKTSWKTAKNPVKKNYTGEEDQDATSPWDLYENMHRRYADRPEYSGYQWSQEYFDGLPTIRKTVTALQERPGAILDVLAKVYDEVRQEFPHQKVGMIADMCAAGLFLHLSFQNQ